ncbi:MAG: hypothetical protein FJX59_21220, partial [Alphaproteobacteria bacterium]|nr:hypothetical protein [Alphaproteobacteria bacterium]
MTPEQAIALVRSEGITPRKGAKIETDRYTARGRALGYISDESFLSLFSDAAVEVLDFTGYQGATIIHDLCAPMPAALLGKFDFIYNGSVLDNLFDSAAAMDNITRPLAPSGVAFHYEGARHFGWAYAEFPPEWFFDYAAINKFDDCK